MACEKHKVRKQKSCPDCIAELAELTKSVNSPDDTEEIVKPADRHDSNINLEPPPNPHQGRVYDAKAVRVLVEAEIQKAINRVKSELDSLTRISWEHTIIPYNSFSMKLMCLLEKEGWKFCDAVRREHGKVMGYNEDDNFFIIQRVFRADNPPIPDFKKSGAVARFINKYENTDV